MLTEKQKKFISSSDRPTAFAATVGALMGYVKYNQWKDGDEFQDEIYKLVIEIESLLDEHNPFNS